MTEENKEKKSQFSPLQTGCAFVMLTNMLIYLGVVAFVFNMLDPSKLDASYLAKRSFTAQEDPESEQDREFRQISEQKKIDQAKSVSERRSGIQSERQDTSAASQLSEMKSPARISAAFQDPKLPVATLIADPLSTRYNTTGVAKSRLYKTSVFPQASLHRTITPYRTLSERSLSGEPYYTVSVELAPGITLPAYRIPSAKGAEESTYTPPSPLPPTSKGGVNISTAPKGASAIATNQSENAEEIPLTKDAL